MKTVTETPEILVVDDIPDAAKTYAELINIKYRLNVAHAENEQEAMDVVNNHNIKVVVLDQVMPNTSGTELLKKIRLVNSNIKAIMLTGEATSKDVGQAINMGFNAYLNKSDNIIKKLPDIVFDLFLKYEIEISRKHVLDNKILLHIERRFKLFPLVKYNLLSISQTTDKYVFEDQWKSISSISAGEEREFQEEIKYEDKVIVTKEIEDKISAEFNFTSACLPSIKSSLNKTLAKRFSSKFESSKSKASKTSKKNSLPQHSADIEKIFVVRRVIEAAPVYCEFRALIEKRCTLCGSVQLFPIHLYKQTRKYASNQIDYLSDNTSKTTNTGHHELS